MPHFVMQPFMQQEPDRYICMPNLLVLFLGRVCYEDIFYLSRESNKKFFFSLEVSESSTVSEILEIA